MTFEAPEPGLFVVRYGVAADLAPALQGPLVSALEERLKTGRVGIVFDVAPAVTMVEIAVPSFWLDVTGRLPITAMCIVTRSSAVRIAAHGFRLAQSMRKHPIAVHTVEDVDQAVTWVRGQLASAGPA